MEITNIHNLPRTIVNAVSVYNRKPSSTRFSVSDLIAPPQIHRLKMGHWDELKEDASDRLWVLLGSATHYVLVKGADKNTLSEEKMEAKVGAVTVVGMADLWDNGELSDWKVTSVYSFILGDKPEWEAQLNLYAWLYRQHGFEVDKLTINAILRDWQGSKALADSDYPRIPFQSVDIPIWTPAKCGQFIKDSIAERTIFGDVRPCTPAEMWERPTQYAVMKDGNKRALRVFDKENEALNYISSLVDPSSDNFKKGTYRMDTRTGARVRCASYCPVNEYCQQKKDEA